MNFRQFVPIIALIVITSVVSGASPSPAEVSLYSTTNWNLVGTYSLDFIARSGGTWPHTMTITSQKDGSFTGTGYGKTDGQPPWTIWGNINGSVISYKILYTGSPSGYTVEGTGIILPDGKLSLTWLDSAGIYGNVVTTSGAAIYSQNINNANQNQAVSSHGIIPPQNSDQSVFSGNLWMILIVLGCVSVTSIVIVVKKKDSQKIPQNVIAMPHPIPSTPSPQQVPVLPVQPSPMPTPLVIQKSGPLINKVMNDLPRQKLKEIIANYGTGIISDPSKVKGLLLDYCATTKPLAGGNYPKEIHILSLALSQNIPQDLLTTSLNEPFEFRRGRLQKRLTDLAIEEPAAKWAVESWAEALSVNIKDKI